MRAAFLCYASSYGEWVRALHRDLETHLGAGTVWLDEADLGTGCSWVAGLQEGLAHADRVVLVATPEAFASPWVQNELDAFRAAHPRWNQDRLVQLALLVDTPLPPFLGSVQQVDFRKNDDATYAEGLRQLVGVLYGLRDPRRFPTIPDGPRAPSLPEPGLEPDLRNDLVRLLTPLLSWSSRGRGWRRSSGFPRRASRTTGRRRARHPRPSSSRPPVASPCLRRDVSSVMRSS